MKTGSAVLRDGDPVFLRIGMGGYNSGVMYLILVETCSENVNSKPDHETIKMLPNRIPLLITNFSSLMQ